MTLPVNAANEYGSGDWSNGWSWWSQGQSAYPGMREYGCLVVAQAKMLVAAGIASSDTSAFNPDRYYEWEVSNGYVNSGMYTLDYAGPVAYAREVGKTITYEGVTKSNCEEKVWQNINAGKYSILRTLDGSSHYVLVNNDASKQLNRIRVFQSWNSSTIPGTRDWTNNTTEVLTFSAGADTVPDAPHITIASQNWHESDTINIYWDAVPNATSYTYYLAEFPVAFAYTTNARTGSTTERYLSFTGLKNGNYSLFVHANNSLGSSGQSNWLSFNVYKDDYIPTVIREYNGHIYALYDYEMSWTFARDFCKSLGGYTCCVTDEEENKFVNELIKSGGKDAYWLGAQSYDAYWANDSYNIDYRWVSGEQFSFTNWAAGEPSASGDLGLKELFLEVRKSYGSKWNDVYNTNYANKGFILEIDPSSFAPVVTGHYDGHTYSVFDVPLSWTEAKFFCEMLGGHLATYGTKAEFDAVSQIMSNGKTAWYHLGAKKTNNVWSWVDGTSFSKEVFPWKEDYTALNYDYLMEYRSLKQLTGLRNVYTPLVEQKSNIGFVVEIDKIVNHPELEHHYVATVTPPTCTEPGYTTYVCSGCGDTYVADNVAALGHKPGAMVIENEKEPTCTASGSHDEVVYCTVCQKELSRVTNMAAALGHLWDAGTVTTEPTEEREGVRTYTCTRCGETKTETIPKLEPSQIENPFADVKEGTYYYNAVLWAVQNNITSGTSATTFSPNDGCTRAQVVTFLWRAAGSPEPKTTSNPFADVPSGKWYSKAVLWAAEESITAGTSATTFSPDATCTRGQIVTFLWRYEDQPNASTTDNPFADVKAGAYYEKAVLWAAETGVTAGTSATTFSPDATCTRAQVVTFLYRDLADK